MKRGAIPSVSHDTPNQITGAQLRAARALLRWTAEMVAERSRVGIATIKRAEGFDGATRLTSANRVAIRAALETAGVEFIEENGGGPGVRLRKNAREVNKP